MKTRTKISLILSAICGLAIVPNCLFADYLIDHENVCFAVALIEAAFLIASIALAAFPIKRKSTSVFAACSIALLAFTGCQTGDITKAAPAASFTQTDTNGGALKWLNEKNMTVTGFEYEAFTDTNGRPHVSVKIASGSSTNDPSTINATAAGKVGIVGAAGTSLNSLVSGIVGAAVGAAK